MRRMLIAALALLVCGAGHPDTTEASEAVKGAIAGGVGGAIVAGPVGAAVGGIGGAVVGSRMHSRSYPRHRAHRRWLRRHHRHYRHDRHYSTTRH